MEVISPAEAPFPPGNSRLCQVDLNQPAQAGISNIFRILKKNIKDFAKVLL